jgi:hypothetical protein
MTWHDVPFQSLGRWKHLKPFHTFICLFCPYHVRTSVYLPSLSLGICTHSKLLHTWFYLVHLWAYTCAPQALTPVHSTLLVPGHTRTSLWCDYDMIIFTAFCRVHIYVHIWSYDIKRCTNLYICAHLKLRHKTMYPFVYMCTSMYPVGPRAHTYAHVLSYDIHLFTFFCP